MAKTKEAMSMKVIVLVAILIAFGAGFMVARVRYKAQLAEVTNAVIERDEKISNLNSLRNRIVVENDGLVQYQDGEIIVLEDDVLLADGTQVTLDGVLIMTDGEEIQLSEGDSVLMDGTVLRHDEVMMMQEEE